MRSRFLHLTAVMGFIFALAGCAGLSDSELRLETGKEFFISRYKTAALIVARVGNTVRWMCPAEITPETDYANPQPVTLEHALGLQALKDVVIENDGMIKNRLPGYPYAMRRSNSLYIKFHKNITPLVHEAASAALSESGLHVIDGLAALKQSGYDPYAMTVAAMVSKLSGQCDCVMFVHYEDNGEYNWVTTSTETTTFKNTTTVSEKHGTGFTGLAYAFSLFDGRTGARQLAGYQNVLLTNIADDLRDNPASTDKILVAEKTKGAPIFGEMTETGVRILLSEPELWRVFRTYIIGGSQYSKSIRGLHEYLALKGANLKN